MADQVVEEAAPAGPTPEQRNDDRRSQIAARSAAALKAAIAEVSTDKPKVEPAPAKVEEPAPDVSAPEPVDPGTGTPVSTEVDTAPPAAEVIPAKPNIARDLEAKARRAKAMRDQARAATERATQAEAQLQANAKRLAEYEERERRLAAQPFEALAERGVDLTKAVPDWLNKATLTPEQQELAALKKKQAELEQFQTRQDAIIKGQELQSRQAAFQQSIATAIQDRDAYEYVHQKGGVQYVFDIIVEHYNEKEAEYRAGRCTQEELNRYSREDLSPAVMAKALEAYEEAQVDTRRSAKKFQAKYGDVKPVATTTATAPAPGTRAARREALLSKEEANSQTLEQLARSMPKLTGGTRMRQPDSLAGNGGVRTIPWQQNRHKSEKDAIAAAVKALDDGNRASQRR